MKTSELTGTALDLAVAKCEGVKLNEGNTLSNDCDVYSPSTDWMQGGPIIERERINLWNESYEWEASFYGKHIVWGDTLLVAAMRCYVASKLGDEVEIPEELKE